VKGSLHISQINAISQASAIAMFSSRTSHFNMYGIPTGTAYTDKKENHIFLTYEEIQNGAVIYGEIFSHFLIY
jgi:hypothetical protein